jgi:hypothetical protein
MAPFTSTSEVVTLSGLFAWLIAEMVLYNTNLVGTADFFFAEPSERIVQYMLPALSTGMRYQFCDKLAHFDVNSWFLRSTMTRSNTHTSWFHGEWSVLPDRGHSTISLLDLSCDPAPRSNWFSLCFLTSWTTMAAMCPNWVREGSPLTSYNRTTPEEATVLLDPGVLA